MKRLSLLLGLLLANVSAYGEHFALSPEQVEPEIHMYHRKDKDPLIVVVLMVANESAVIRPTLQPYIDAGIRAFFVLDTGSEDDTIEQARALFEEYNIPNAIIMQEPWIDFEVSRNHALEYTEKCFPKATFMLMPDAEWYMHNVEGLIQFCKEYKHDYNATYQTRLIGNNCDWYMPRLGRCHCNARFIGDIHEVWMPISGVKVPGEVYFEVRASQYGYEKSCRRWKRDLEKLLNSYERDPHSSRTVFYLAQTYACLGDVENACLWYQRRVNMQGWDEEDFIAHYRLAQTYESLDNWEKALFYYTKAFSMRPHRIEPLVRLFQHYWSTGDQATSYLYAKRACELPYPEYDVLFREKEIYDYVRYDALGCAAWYVGDYESGLWAVNKALEIHPEMQHLQNNRALYESKVCQA